MYGAKAKGLFIKEISKVHGVVSQEFELYRSKNMKNGSQLKSFQSNVNTLMGGHICSFLQVR